jgi:hypothetical protein
MAFAECPRSDSRAPTAPLASSVDRHDVERRPRPFARMVKILILRFKEVKRVDCCSALSLTLADLGRVCESILHTADDYAFRAKTH